MWMNLFPALRLAHCGANLSWSLLWLIADAETKENTRILGLSHDIMSLAGVAILGLVEAGQNKAISHDLAIFNKAEYYWLILSLDLFTHSPSRRPGSERSVFV